ncbi:MAG: AMIN domain-containing protein, partial [Myxococcales bacterium]|nr:AMIN domain-containing protein [Myxococcales bacterium]
MTRIASTGLAARCFLFEVVLLGLLGGGLFLEDAAAQSARPATVLVDVAVEEPRNLDARRATRARIHLRTDGVPPPPLIFALSEPTRLVIDLPDLASRVERVRVPVDSTVARSVRVGRHASFTRIVVDAGDTPDPFGRWRLERAESGWTVVLGEGTGPPASLEERAPDLAREELVLPRGGLPPVSAPPKPTRIYGVELEVDERRERVLIFAERGVTPEVSDGDTQSVVIDFPEATLDPSAPGHVAPDVGKGISSISVFERGDTEIPTVRMVIERAGRLPPEVTRRGAIVALEFTEEWAASGGVTLEFRNAPLREVVKAISEVTGDRFVYDSLEGTVTVSAGGRITRNEAMELLHAALLMRGYAALQSPGGAYKILPIQAGTASGPWRASDELSGAAPVTTLIQLRSVSPQRVVDALRGWLGQQLIALPFPRTNSIILSGSADRIQRILTVIRALDESSDTEFAIVRLRYRDAADAAALIENVQKEGERNAPEVFVDERSNALLVRAAPQRLAEVRSFLRTLDRPVEGGGGVHVLRLHAADPEQIANVLNGLSQGSGGEGALAESASALLNKEFQITVDAPTRSLLVRSSEETFRALAEIVAELDRIPPRIRLEVLVLELTSSGALSLGFDAFSPISNPKDQNDTIAAVLVNPSGGGLIQPGTPGGPRGAVRFTRAPLIVPIVNSEGVPVSVQVPRESFVVTADASELEGRVLMRPNLL